MTKRKRRALISILSVLLVCVLLFVFVWFAPYGRHKVTNTEVLKTEVRVPPPDSVAVIRGGIAIEVSDEKRDQIYAAFMQAFAEQEVRGDQCFCSLQKDDITKCILLNLNVEFRYRQRRKFMYTKFMGTEYDAILFSFDKEHLIPLHFLDGQYQPMMFNSVHFVDETYYTDFKKAIKHII